MKLQRVEEYIQTKGNPIFIHGLDAVKHILRGDYRQTAYKDPYPNPEHLDALREAMEERPEPGNFNQILEDTYTPKQKRKRRRAKMGDLDIDLYIDQNGKDPFYETYRKPVPRPAITIFMDLNISYGMRSGTDMEERHSKIYSIVLKAEAERQPCRVIGAKCIEVPEFRRNNPIRYYIVIKDFSDPIFPGIWGAFKRNETTNDFTNCCSDYIIGTSAPGNGLNVRWNILRDFPHDECQVINPGMIRKGE